jgi:hypothetical protein
MASRSDEDAGRHMPEDIDRRKSLHQPDPWPSRFPLDRMRARFDRPLAIFNAAHGVRRLPPRISDLTPVIASLAVWPPCRYWRNP